MKRHSAANFVLQIHVVNGFVKLVPDVFKSVNTKIEIKVFDGYRVNKLVVVAEMNTNEKRTII